MSGRFCLIYRCPRRIGQAAGLPNESQLNFCRRPDWSLCADADGGLLGHSTYFEIYTIRAGMSPATWQFLPNFGSSFRIRSRKKEPKCRLHGAVSPVTCSTVITYYLGLGISVCVLLLLRLFHAALSAPLVDLVHLMQNKH